MNGEVGSKGAGFQKGFSGLITPFKYRGIADNTVLCNALIVLLPSAARAWCGSRAREAFDGASTTSDRRFAKCLSGLGGLGNSRGRRGTCASVGRLHRDGRTAVSTGERRIVQEAIDCRTPRRRSTKDLCILSPSPTSTKAVICERRGGPNTPLQMSISPELVADQALQFSKLVFPRLSNSRAWTDAHRHAAECLSLAAATA